MNLENNKNIYDSLLSYSNFFFQVIYSLVFLLIIGSIEQSETRNFLLLLFSAVSISQVFHFGIQRTAVRYLGFIDSFQKNKKSVNKSSHTPVVLKFEKNFLNALFNINYFYRIYSALIFLVFFLGLSLFFNNTYDFFVDEKQKNLLFLSLSIFIFLRYFFYGSFVANESLGLIKLNYLASIIGFLFSLAGSLIIYFYDFNVFNFSLIFFSYQGLCGLFSSLIFNKFSKKRITIEKVKNKLNKILMLNIMSVSIKSGSASSTHIVLNNAPNFLVSSYIDLQIANSFIIVRKIFELLENFSQAMVLALNNFFVRAAFAMDKEVFAQNYFRMNLYSLLIYMLSYILLAFLMFGTTFFNYFGYENLDGMLFLALSALGFLQRWVSQYSSVTNFFDYIVEHYFALAAIINFFVITILFILINDYFIFVAGIFTQTTISFIMSKYFISKVIDMPFIRKSALQPITLFAILVIFNYLIFEFII